MFDLLHEAVRAAIARRGLSEPTEPQRRAIPLILAGHNVLIISPTGSGKTEAAILPVFSLMLGSIEGRGIYALYITPLRALNRDLLERLRWWASEVGLKVDVRHGDTDVADRQRQSRDPPHLLITTPEMLQAILSGRRLRDHMAKLRWVIVDEVHELAEDKRGVQLAVTLERLRGLAGRDLQVVGLSATVGTPEEVARFLFGAGRDFKVVKVDITRRIELGVVRPAPRDEDAALAERILSFPDVAARIRYMRELIDGERATLVFVNTRSIAELLGFRFRMAFGDYPIAVHHGSLSKASRVSVEQDLREGRLRAVIATSSLELGIDIGHVDLVIQHMSPHQVTRLVQRVGRSGHRLDLVPRGVIVTDDVNDTLEAMAIVARARAGWLEPIRVPSKPYDVLANQIVAMLVTRPRWKVEEIYRVVKGAYPYRDLALEELRYVLRFMHSLYPRLAFYVEDEDVVVRPRSRKFYRYFYDTLSMIPDEKQYAVVDVTSDEPVGFLDEAFVAEYGTVGTKFVFRGRPWIIVDIDGSTIRVRPTDDPQGAVPSWVGEEIPVPYEVAQDVGRMKERVAALVRSGGVDGAVKALLGEYPIDGETARYVVDAIAEHVKSGEVVPSHRVILVEPSEDESVAIIHAHFGTLINRALARLIGDALAEMYGYSVGVQQDAYNILVKAGTKLPPNAVVLVLHRLTSMDTKELLESARTAVIRTGLFKRRLIHVGKKFGVIDRDADIYTITLRKLVEVFSGTPVFEEALRETLEKDIDVDGAVKVLRGIAGGELEVVVASSPTPLGRLAYEKMGRRLELIPPERMDRLILESTYARLSNEALLLVCLDCGWHATRKVGEVAGVGCPRCGSTRVGALRRPPVDGAERLVQRLLEGRPRKGEERAAEELHVTSRLLGRWGVRALYAIASRASLGRVADLLERAPADREGFIRAIVEAEKEEIRERILE